VYLITDQLRKGKFNTSM